MSFVEAFRNNRLDYLKQYQHLHSTLDRNFSLCSNQYIKKYPKVGRLEAPNMSYSRNPTLFFFAQKSSMNTVRERKRCLFVLAVQTAVEKMNLI